MIYETVHEITLKTFRHLILTGRLYCLKCMYDILTLYYSMRFYFFRSLIKFFPSSISYGLINSAQTLSRSSPTVVWRVIVTGKLVCVCMHACMYVMKSNIPRYGSQWVRALDGSFLEAATRCGVQLASGDYINPDDMKVLP